ncbi:NAD(P)-binding domain-containing protein [Paenibacillus sp. MMO-58]|uniref:NAD(P)-binding domain-containing protein n=1 Tax=Paenibacillus sp. MMO-58 TaxID=3081290 RepID=UPI003015C751
MKIGIIGAGNAGRTLGLAFAKQGYTVMLGSRQPEKLAALEMSGEENLSEKVLLDVMVDPGIVANGDHDLFMCGNDTVSKQMVSDLLKGAFGWKQIYDLGDLSAAQATEGLALLASRVAAVLGHGMINFKVAL